jgi:primase-polymerase (primpol)-like protein
MMSVTERNSQNNRSSKPPALPVILDNIPIALCQRQQFGVWQFEEFADEETGEVWWDKIPINARTGWRASSTNPQTWSAFDVAARAYERGGYDGLAYFLHRDAGIVGIDLDKCRAVASGAIERWARHIVDKLHTYTELSPSARGLRSFVFGKLPPRDRREGRFECYESARFLTLTGHRLGRTPPTIEHRQAELIEIHTEIFAARVARRNATPPPPGGGYVPHNLSDLAIIEKAGTARNGAKFRRLYSGDISGHNSHSEADAALCSMLAFYVGPDPARIDELFRGSGLMRAKWDRLDYKNRTIALALEGRTEFYTSRRKIRRQRRQAHFSISFTLEVS